MRRHIWPRVHHLIALAVIAGPTPVVAAQEPSRAARESSQDQSQTPPLAQVPPAADAQLELRLKLPQSIWTTSPLVPELDCIGCGFDGATFLSPPRNPNAPWAVQGFVRYPTRAGTISTGVIGVRNYDLPLYLAMPVGGPFNGGTPLSTSQASSWVSTVRWHVSTAVERTLWTGADGRTLGLTADALLPLTTAPVDPDPSSHNPLPSRAFRFGVIVRW